MVRISEQAHQRLRERAAQSGEPMQTVADKALENYRRQKFSDNCDAAYTALQQDPDAWKNYPSEMKSLEGTLMDDLDPTVGHEQAGEQPLLILSTNPFNNSPARLVAVPYQKFQSSLSPALKKLETLQPVTR